MVRAERIGNVSIRARAPNVMGWIYGEIQDHEQAMVWNRRGVEDARQAGFPNPEVECNALLNLADNLMAIGHLDEAETHLRYVEQIARHLGLPASTVKDRCYRALLKMKARLRRRDVCS